MIKIQEESTLETALDDVNNDTTISFDMEPLQRKFDEMSNDLRLRMSRLETNVDSQLTKHNDYMTSEMKNFLTTTTRLREEMTSYNISLKKLTTEVESLEQHFLLIVSHSDNLKKNLDSVHDTIHKVDDTLKDIPLFMKENPTSDESSIERSLQMEWIDAETTDFASNKLFSIQELSLNQSLIRPVAIEPLTTIHECMYN